MTDLTSDDLARMRIVAEAATPGTWDHRGWDVGPPGGCYAVWAGAPEESPVVADTQRECQGWYDAAHIATFDPPTVLALMDELEAEQAKVAAALALHNPIRVYDKCEHDADHGCEPIEVYDYMGCSESVIGWGCSTCCYDDEYPREDCPHGADHMGVPRDQSCPTRVALGASLR